MICVCLPRFSLLRLVSCSVVSGVRAAQAKTHPRESEFAQMTAVSGVTDTRQETNLGNVVDSCKREDVSRAQAYGGVDWNHRRAEYLRPA